MPLHRVHNIVKAVLAAAESGHSGSAEAPHPSAQADDTARTFAQEGLGA